MAQLFNACEYLLDRRLAAGDGQRLALTGPAGDLTYAELHDRVLRTAAGLRAAGVQPEQRVLMVMSDSPDFVVVYLAAMRVGAVPVPVSTMLRADGIAELLRDSRARFLAVTHEFAAAAESAAAAAPELAGVLADSPLPASTRPVHLLSELAAAAPDDVVYDTSPDSPAFWLYTSGTTGTPKGAMHRHGSVQVVCETYGTQVLGIRPDDRCLSAAKAFFAYGLGNSVLFPMSVGAAAVLNPVPSRPDIIVDAAAKYGATLFFGGPTFFANMLRAGIAPDALAGVRLAASAGEALPAALYDRWTSRFGIDILDGIGMTEMLHIFLSNRPGAGAAGDDRRGRARLRPAAARRGHRRRGDRAGHARHAVRARLVLGDRLLGAVRRVPAGVPGRVAAHRRHLRAGRRRLLRVPGPHRRHAQGERHLGVADGGRVQAARPPGRRPGGRRRRGRRGRPGEAGRLRRARRADSAAAPVTEAELVEFCRAGLPSFKRPRAVVFTEGFPTTATGKVRRVELRAMAAEVLNPAAITAAGAPGEAP